MPRGLSGAQRIGDRGGMHGDNASLIIMPPNLTLHQPQYLFHVELSFDIKPLILTFVTTLYTASRILYFVESNPRIQIQYIKNYKIK